MHTRPLPTLRPARSTRSAVRRRLAALAVLGAVAAGGGCSFSASSGDSPRAAAERLIEGDLAEQNELGKVTATCDEPADKEPGTTFECTSTSELGTIAWLTTIEEDDKIGVKSVNLVTADALEELEAAAVGELEDQIGAEIGVENLECGDGPVILDDDGATLCALTDPASPDDVYDATLTVTDVDSGEFRITVADAPR